REMLQSGNLFVPHLNYVVYVEKPPLLYWLTMLSFWTFGVSEFAARLPVALSAIAGILATYLFALRAFGRRHAILAAAILATTPLYALMAQVLTTDMMLTALVTIATFSLYLHWEEGGRWCWIAYVAMGLAVMTKGPVGVAIPILAMLLWLTLNRELGGAIAKFRAIPGLLLTILIAAPWFVAMTVRAPGFADFYFVGEHLRRVFDSNYSHSEAFYFYLPVLAVGLLPWSLLVPFLTWRESPRNPARNFCIVAAGVTVVAFSCASAKLIPYILPAVPPLAVLIADGLVSCAWPATDSRAAIAPPDSRILIESGPMRAHAGLSRAIAATAPDAAIICYHRYVQSLSFYNRRRIVLLGGRTELDFGSRLDPDAREWFLNSDEQMFRRWEQPSRVVVVLDAGDLARMKERFGDFDVIAIEGKKRAIIRREGISRRGPITFN